MRGIGREWLKWSAASGVRGGVGMAMEESMSLEQIKRMGEV